jgi:hypothetical protein
VGSKQGTSLIDVAEPIALWVSASKAGGDFSITVGVEYQANRERKWVGVDFIRNPCWSFPLPNEAGLINGKRQASLGNLPLRGSAANKH